MFSIILRKKSFESGSACGIGIGISAFSELAIDEQLLELDRNTHTYKAASGKSKLLFLLVLKKKYKCNFTLVYLFNRVLISHTVHPKRNRCCIVWVKKKWQEFSKLFFYAAKRRWKEGQRLNSYGVVTVLYLRSRQRSLNRCCLYRFPGVIHQ